ncbi:MAG TPA: condensation domain-containing protein, partial [Solirubrobacterales bacterium]|nr:condensation domain-containing protein [Solirubrobacterales bacterium]
MRRENVEDVYRLSPVQQGMLFHCVRSGRAAMYLQQFQRRTGPGFDAAAFVRAWQAAVDANPALRTFFLWRDLEEPVQVVARRVELPVERHDWSDLPPAEREARLAELVAADRRRGFDLARAPLLRLGIVRWGCGDEDEHCIIWTYHHLILDGWSVGVLLQEVGALYEAALASRPRAPERRRPFRDYVAWLRGQGLAEAESYWRSRLAGFAAPTPLGVAAPAAPAADAGAGMGIETIR